MSLTLLRLLEARQLSNSGTKNSPSHLTASTALGARQGPPKFERFCWRNVCHIGCNLQVAGGAGRRDVWSRRHLEGCLQVVGWTGRREGGLDTSNPGHLREISCLPSLGEILKRFHHIISHSSLHWFLALTMLLTVSNLQFSTGTRGDTWREMCCYQFAIETSRDFHSIFWLYPVEI